MFELPFNPFFPIVPVFPIIPGVTAPSSASVPQPAGGAQPASPFDIPPNVQAVKPPDEFIQEMTMHALGKPSTPPDVYDDLVYYFKYASTAYTPLPLLANGHQVIAKLWELFTDVNGYIALDHQRKEIVVAFRGSASPANFIIDFTFALVKFDNAAAQAAKPGTQVHAGFQIAWKAVSTTVLQTVATQLQNHPDYTIVTCGHSLGGALASVAGVTLQLAYPNNKVRMYTYGQPRTGDPLYADLADKIFQGRIFRVVHTWDGVPTMVLEAFGYKHHGTEYWSFDLPSPSTTRICYKEGEEDPKGSMSIPTTGISLPHLFYFGIAAGFPFFL